MLRRHSVGNIRNNLTIKSHRMHRDIRATPPNTQDRKMKDIAARSKFNPIYLLLALPYLALLWVPLYNRTTPELFGIPFFYWFQMLWVPLCSLCILPVYLSEERRGK